MSTRTNLRPQIVIPSAAASPANSSAMSASITSAPTILQSLTRVAYGISWTAGSTPVGTVSVQCSNDYALHPDGSVANAGTWDTMTLDQNGQAVTSIAVSGNSGSGFIDITTGAYGVRLLYTRVSGSGTLTVTVNGKVS